MAIIKTDTSEDSSGNAGADSGATGARSEDDNAPIDAMTNAAPPQTEGASSQTGSAQTSEGQTASRELSPDAAQKDENPQLSVSDRMKQLAQDMLHMLGIAKQSVEGQNVMLSADAAAKSALPIDPAHKVQEIASKVTAIPQAVIAQAQQAMQEFNKSYGHSMVNDASALAQSVGVAQSSAARSQSNV